MLYYRDSELIMIFVKKTYLLGLFLFFLSGSLANASGLRSKAGFEILSKSNYECMRSRLHENEDLMLISMENYMKSPNSRESAFQVCMGAYVCGSRLERSFIEDELANIGDVVMQAQSLLKRAYGLKKSATMAEVEKYEAKELAKKAGKK
ncbi:MAG: hypothetical protein LBI70_02025 [Rickettsiales bacterium]|jgi:hypothetical protein|nr:hypothetical protein [Rickettsiales bacterium]